MYLIGGKCGSLSFIFTHPPEDNLKKIKKIKALTYVCTILHKSSKTGHLRFGGRICTTINTTAVQAQNIYFEVYIYIAFSWAKTPLVACIFYLILICTLFWINVNRYTFFFGYFPIFRAKRVSNSHQGYIPKKKSVRVCVRLILVLVWKNCLGFSVGYVLCASPYSSTSIMW